MLTGEKVTLRLLRAAEIEENLWLSTNLEARGRHWTSTEIYYYLFEVEPIRRLQLHIDPDNVASQHIAAKCGYRLEGLVRGVFFMNGRAEDLGLYGRLSSDPSPL
ncbi:MAG: GNAT family protein [Actinomycetes bacterium]